MVEKPCDGRDGAEFALKVTSCANTSVVCQESFRNPGDGNPRNCQASGNHHIFLLIRIYFFDPEPRGNCCISCSIVAESYFFITILIFFLMRFDLFLIPHPKPRP